MKKRHYLTLIAILIVLSSIFTYKYIKHESPVYIFDYSGYWEIFKNYSEGLVSSPKQFIRDTISLVRNADYNNTPTILIFPFYLIFKNSRFGYILGLSLFYIVPTIVLSIVLIRKMIFKEQDEKINNKNNYIFTIFICIAAFLYTRWWSPTLRGLPDIIAVIPLIIAALIVHKHSFLKKQKIRIPIFIGFILYLCFLFRRYFVYAIIGFYVSLFIVELIDFIKCKENKKESFKNAFKNFFIAGLTTILCVLAIQMPLVKTILGENYSESYSAYQTSILNHVQNAINEFGYIILIFALIGLIYTLIKKQHRKDGIFCFLNIVVCYGTFMKVQAMGVHHYLTISVWIFILFIYGIYAIWELLKNNILKIIWLALIIALMSLNFATTYIFRDLKIPFLTQNNQYCKFYYENFDELERLINDIDKLICDGNYKFSALAGSEILSDNILDLLGTEKMKKSIVYTSAIDLRDGINFNSLMSDYMVVTDIAQTGTSETGQRIISVPNDAIINSTSIGKAYSLISGPYIVRGGVKAYIYHKDRAFYEDEVDEYMQILTNYHPQWKTEYNDLDKAILMSERTLGEAIGDVRRYKYETLYFLPGFTPTEYTINLNKKINTLDLRLYVYGTMNTEDPTVGNVFVTLKGDDETVYEGEISYKQEEQLQLKLSDYNKLTFIVDKNEYLNCDWLYIDMKNVTFND